LEWPGKREAIVIANLPTTKTLRPVREDSVDFDNTENLYIEGDNLEVLKILQESYIGKIKMIYIDPPYNTGNDFVYRDNFDKDKETELFESGQIDEYSRRLVANPEASGRYHSDWLSMMYPRLKLARTLLSEDGVIFISIDDNEVHNLRKVCDEVFGEENFVTELPRITKKAGKTTDTIAKNNDYVICFRKSEIAEFNSYAHNDNGYKYSDEFANDRGLYKLSQTLDYGSIQYSPSLDYEIELGGVIFRPGGVSEEEMILRQKRNPKSDFCWRWSKDLFQFGSTKGFVVVKGNRIYTKTYQNATISKNGSEYMIDFGKRTKSATSLDFIENEYSNDNSKKDLSKLFDTKVFEYSKPVSLLYSLAYITTAMLIFK
jgi:adenine specific DNA methylase Mod